jgi:phospholipase/carboxylesterase
MSVESYVHATLPGEDVLVLAFHGTGGDERQFLPLARSIWPQAEIVAPRGDVSEHGALRFFRRTGEGVYDFDDLARRTAAMSGFVAAHKARAPRSRTIGIGYSNGANILTSVALAEPGLFDDVALLHPLIPWRPKDDARLAALRVLITAGRRDPICPAPQTLALAEFFSAQGAKTQLEWHEGGHELRESEIEALSAWSVGPSGNRSQA